MVENFYNKFGEKKNGERELTDISTTWKLKLKYKPSLRTIRDRVEWESNNYKTELNGCLTTLELKKPHSSRLVGGARMWNGLVPHSHVAAKNLRRITWEWGVPDLHRDAQTRVPVPGRLPQLLAVKTTGLSQWKKLLEAQAVPLKELTHRLAYSDSLTLSSSNQVADWKEPVVNREILKYLASRQAEAIVSFLNHPCTEPESWYDIWDSINLANTLWPALEIPRDSIPPSLPAHHSYFSIWMASFGSGFTTS